MNTKDFWNWFIENKLFFENILSNMENVSQEEVENKMTLFEENLQKCNENLWFRMGSQNPFELIITAEGNKRCISFCGRIC